MKPDREDAAYTVDCPLCHSPKGERCTYVRPEYVGRYTPHNPRWGTATQRPHNQRLHKRWELDLRKRSRDFQQQMAIKHADPYAAERRALADLMKQEHADMLVWLRRYGRIFWTENTTQRKDA